MALAMPASKTPIRVSAEPAASSAPLTIADARPAGQQDQPDAAHGAGLRGPQQRPGPADVVGLADDPVAVLDPVRRGQLDRRPDHGHLPRRPGLGHRRRRHRDPAAGGRRRPDEQERQLVVRLVPAR
ncbi:hypothetical protein [Modestobacter sp. DSM 44400]|uniref:hypothetical protein n=1 Tax=Modestobacter sp. DSM 44400 TaxID=1550230 RepID=UPI0011154750|nr:hypothetical protein [Modestobacter sp. DSM 44400]